MSSYRLGDEVHAVARKIGKKFNLINYAYLYAKSEHR